MQTTITLKPGETMSTATKPDGTTVVTIPQDVLIRAYCDYVAAQVYRPAAVPKGDRLQ